MMTDIQYESTDRLKGRLRDWKAERQQKRFSETCIENAIQGIEAELERRQSTAQGGRDE